MPPAQETRQPYWPALIAIGVPTVLVLLRASPLAPDLAYVLMGIPLLFLFWVTAALVAAVSMVRAFRRHERRRAIAMGILPLVVSIALIRPLHFIYGANFVGDYIHLTIMRPTYMAQIGAMTGAGPKVLVVDWGGMVWASSGVIYDESDQIRLPADGRSTAWRDRAEHNGFTCEPSSIQSAGGHFYFAGFPC